MAKKAVVLFGGGLRHAASAWLKRLGTPDASQLESLIELARQEQTPLDQILSRLFPDKDEAKALTAFASLRKRLNDASVGKLFDLPDLGLRVVVDSRKRDEPVNRKCWFTGPNLRSEAAAEMSRLSVQDVVSLNPISSQAIATSTGALRTGKRTVHFFVSYSRAEEESRMANDLLSRLRTEFGASPRYEVNLWQDTHIGIDKQWHAEIQKAIAECDFGFMLVCPAFLNSKYIREDELPAFITPEGMPGIKPVIAVGLAKIDFLHQELRGLEEQQIFLWQRSSGAPQKFYSDLTNIRDKRLFAHSLFIKCQTALDLRFQSPQANESSASTGTVLSRRKRSPNIIAKDELFPRDAKECDEEPSCMLDPDDTTGDVAQAFIDQARLGQDPERLKHFEKPLAATSPGSQPIDALEYLNDWLNTDKAPPLLYILGDYGIGKTTTLKHLTHDLLQRRKTDSSIPVPLFIDLRHYLFERKQHVPTSIHELLTAVIARNWRLPGPPSVTADDLLEMVRDERALLIFDGLDEKTVHMTSSEARAFIRVLWQSLPEQGHTARSKKRTHGKDENSFDSISEPSPQQPSPQTTKPSGRLIISCRSHYFRDVPAETSMLTGEEREDIDRANTPVLTLLPFDERQIRNYLIGIMDGDAVRADNAIQLIGSIHNMSELATRPYLLSMISERLEEFEESRQRGETVNAARLYQMFTQRWLNRDDGKHSLDPVHKRILMEQLAADLWREGEREMSPDALDLWLDRFLSEHPIIKDAYLATDRTILKEDLRTACFVLRDDQRRDNNASTADVRSSFRFAHSSLQEFFLAAWLWHGLSDGNLKAFELPMASLETLDFLGQLLQLDSERQRAKSLSQMARILEGAHLGAATLAFRYWLRAIERGMPVPKPNKVNLAEANLEEWRIRGHGPNERLDLRSACFRGAQLHRARLEWVELTDADMSQVGMRQALLIDVNADGSQWAGADLSGSQWRIGSLRRADLSEARMDCEMIHVEMEASDQASLTYHSSTTAQNGAFVANVEHGATFAEQKATNSKHGPFALTGHSGLVRSCAWSPDGRHILSAASDHTLKLWDTNSGQCIRTLTGHSGSVHSCAWSPDGRHILSAANDKTLKLWDSNNGQCAKTLTGHSDSIWSCDWSPDGRYILSAAEDKTLKLWNPKNGQCIKTLTGHAGSVWFCAWSPDGGHILSAASDKTLKLWDPNNGQCIKTLTGHSGDVRSCAWSPDGRHILSAAFDKTIKLWDPNNGQCIKTFTGHLGSIWSCAWSPDGRHILSAASDNTFKLSDPENGQCIKTLIGHSARVLSCAWSPEGRHIVSAAFDHTLKLWDPNNGQCIKTLTGHSGYAKSCAWSPNGGHILSAASDNTLKLWDPNSGQCIKTLSGHSGKVWSCAWSSDGRHILSAAEDDTLKLWDANNGQCNRTLTGHSDPVRSCAWSPNGRYILSAAFDNTLKLWDPKNGQCIKTLAGHSDLVLSCAWSPDGRHILSAAIDDTLKLWDPNNGQCIKTLTAHSNCVLTCAWSPDGRHILSGGGDKTLKVWDPNSGQCIKTLTGHSGSVRSCAWSPDGRHILSAADDHTLKLRDSNTGQCIKTLAGHSDSVHSCAWSPDGRHILSAAEDNTLKLWDPNTGNCIRTFYLLPEGQWATIDEPTAMATDHGTGSILNASPEAWRWLGWLVQERPNEIPRRVSIEAFGPIPGLDVPS